MFRTNRLAAHAVSSGACVLDAEPPPPVSLVRKLPPATDETRCCRKCQETKPLEQFKKSGKGRALVCKACDADRARQRYHSDLETSRARSRARQRERFAANPERYRSLARAYARTDRGRELNRRAVAKWRERNTITFVLDRRADSHGRRWPALVRSHRLGTPAALPLRL